MKTVVHNTAQETFENRLAFWQLCQPRPVRRGAGPHYGSARRKFIIGMGTQNADLAGAMGVSGDSINKPSGV